MYDFESNLKTGNKYEDIFVDKFLGNPPDLYRPPGRFRPYDFTTGQIAYEVKSDSIAYKYESFCIQFLHDDKPSGISTTMADLYIIFITHPTKPYRVFAIPVCVMKQAIRDRLWTGILEPRYNQGQNSHCYFMPFSLFSEYEVDAVSCSAPLESQTGSI